MKKMILIVSVLLLVAALSGCGHFKKPFKNNPGKGNNSLPVFIH